MSSRCRQCAHGEQEKNDEGQGALSSWRRSLWGPTATKNQLLKKKKNYYKRKGAFCITIRICLPHNGQTEGGLFELKTIKDAVRNPILHHKNQLEGLWEHRFPGFMVPWRDSSQLINQPSNFQEFCKLVMKHNHSLIVKYMIKNSHIKISYRTMEIIQWAKHWPCKPDNWSLDF